MKITLTEALSKLKMYNKRVDKSVDGLNYVSLIDYKVGDNKRCKNSNLSLEDLEQVAKHFIDKLTALISNRNKLKAIIAQTNAITKVKVGDVEYTIVQAIERKNVLPTEKEVLGIMKRQLTDVKNKIYSINQRAQEKANDIVEAQVQAEAKNKKTDEIEALYNLIYDKNKAEMVDPLNLEKLVQQKEDEITEFEQNIDVALSIVNANTFVEVDLA